VLTQFSDTTFASTAREWLITSQGRVDRQALAYLGEVMKVEAVPILEEAFQDTRLTNQLERVSLVAAVLPYLGQHPDANRMVHAAVTATNLPAPLRAMVVASLAGNDRGALPTEKPADPQAIAARLETLESLRDLVTDDRLRAVIERTLENLRELQQGQAPRPVNVDYREWMTSRTNAVRPSVPTP
jgi:hypothetical protein